MQIVAPTGAELTAEATALTLDTVVVHVALCARVVPMTTSTVVRAATALAARNTRRLLWSRQSVPKRWGGRSARPVGGSREAPGPDFYKKSGRDMLPFVGNMVPLNRSIRRYSALRRKIRSWHNRARSSP